MAAQSNFPSAISGILARDQSVLEPTILREHKPRLRQNEAVLRENQTLIQARRN